MTDSDGVDNGGDDTKDNVKDKLSQRFESEEENVSQPVSGGEASTGKSARGANSSKASKSSKELNSSKASKSSKELNSSKASKNSEGSVTDWKNHSFYLRKNLADQLSSDYKKLDWQLDEHLNQDLKKTRHYYPLIVELGLERLEELDSEEIADRI